MIGRAAFSVALLLLAGQALADDPAACRVAEQELDNSFPLPLVARAIADKKLNVLVLGAGSSTLPGPDGVAHSYPARLEAALKEKLPGITVKVTTDVKAKRTAVEMVKTLEKALSESKPALMVWQTGTVDAMQASDPDQFSAALDKGINIARNAGADVIMMNAQYSPRTESIIALGTYAEDMRWAAVAHEVPLFNRFNIMKLWADQGTFDLRSSKNKLDIAERIHDCMGRLLANLAIEAAKSAAPQVNGGR